MHVITQAERLQQLDLRRQRDALRVQPFAGAGMGGDDHPPAGLGQVSEHFDQPGKLPGKVDILLAMRADQVVVLGG